MQARRRGPTSTDDSRACGRRSEPRRQIARTTPRTIGPSAPHITNHSHRHETRHFTPTTTPRNHPAGRAERRRAAAAGSRCGAAGAAVFFCFLVWLHAPRRAKVRLTPLPLLSNGRTGVVAPRLRGIPPGFEETSESPGRRFRPGRFRAVFFWPGFRTGRRPWRGFFLFSCRAAGMGNLMNSGGR